MPAGPWVFASRLAGIQWLPAYICGLARTRDATCVVSPAYAGTVVSGRRHLRAAWSQNPLRGSGDGRRLSPDNLKSGDRGQYSRPSPPRLLRSPGPRVCGARSAVVDCRPLSLEHRRLARPLSGNPPSTAPDLRAQSRRCVFQFYVSFLSARGGLSRRPADVGCHRELVRLRHPVPIHASAQANSGALTSLQGIGSRPSSRPAGPVKSTHVGRPRSHGLSQSSDTASRCGVKIREN